MSGRTSRPFTHDDVAPPSARPIDPNPPRVVLPTVGDAAPVADLPAVAPPAAKPLVAPPPKPVAGRATAPLLRFISQSQGQMLGPRLCRTTVCPPAVPVTESVPGCPAPATWPPSAPCQFSSVVWGGCIMHEKTVNAPTEPKATSAIVFTRRRRLVRCAKSLAVSATASVCPSVPSATAFDRQRRPAGSSGLFSSKNESLIASPRTFFQIDRSIRNRHTCLDYYLSFVTSFPIFR